MIGSSATVLHLCQPTEYGVPTVVLDHLTDQRAAGLHPVLACPPDGTLPERAAQLGVQVVPWVARREPGVDVARESAAFAAHVRRLEPDLVHLHSAKAGLVGRLVLRSRRPTVFQPHAWSFHAAEGRLGSAALGWERLGARWADRIVCASAAEEAEGRAAGIRGRFVVVPNGADLSRFRPQDDATRAAARARLGIGADTPLAVCVGRLSAQKAQDVLLAAWALMAERLPAARCVLVGDGPDRSELEPRAPEGVSFAGQVPDPRDWYAAADVVVLPSRYETNPLAVIEAMASRRSVVVSDVPSVCEPLPAGSTAAAPVGDPVALAAALELRLRDAVLREREAAANEAHARAHHDVARSAERVRALYREILAERNGARGSAAHPGQAPAALGQ